MAGAGIAASAISAHAASAPEAAAGAALMISAKLRPSLPLRLARLALFLLEKGVLDFIMDAEQPGFGARGAVPEMRGLGLKVSSAFFGGAQLERELVRQVHGAGAVLLGHLGRTLQHGDDGAPGVIGDDIGVRVAFCRRSKWDNGSRPLGSLDAHYHSLPTTALGELQFEGTLARHLWHRSGISTRKGENVCAVALRQRRGEAHVVLNSFLQLDAGKPREPADDAAGEPQHAKHKDPPPAHDPPLPVSGGEVIPHKNKKKGARHRPEQGPQPADER